VRARSTPDHKKPRQDGVRARARHTEEGDQSLVRDIPDGACYRSDRLAMQGGGVLTVLLALLLAAQSTPLEKDDRPVALELVAASKANILCQREAAIRFSSSPETAETVVAAAKGACESLGLKVADAYIAYSAANGLPRSLVEQDAKRFAEGVTTNRLLAFVLRYRSEHPPRR